MVRFTMKALNTTAIIFKYFLVDYVVNQLVT